MRTRANRLSECGGAARARSGPYCCLRGRDGRLFGNWIQSLRKQWMDRQEQERKTRSLPKAPDMGGQSSLHPSCAPAALVHLLRMRACSRVSDREETAGHQTTANHTQLGGTATQRKKNRERRIAQRGAGDCSCCEEFCHIMRSRDLKSRDTPDKSEVEGVFKTTPRSPLAGFRCRRPPLSRHRPTRRTCYPGTQDPKPASAKQRDRRVAVGTAAADKTALSFV